MATNTSGLVSIAVDRDGNSVKYTVADVSATAELVRFGGSVSSANMLQMSVAQAIEGAKVWWVESAGAFGYGVEPGGIIVAPGVGLYLNWAGIEGVPDRTEFCDITANMVRRDRVFVDDDGGVWAADSSGMLVRASGGSQEDLAVEIVAGEI